MKKNKLYIVNKHNAKRWNRPLFMPEENLFGIGGNQSQFFSHQGGWTYGATGSNIGNYSGTIAGGLTLNYGNGLSNPTITNGSGDIVASGGNASEIVKTAQQNNGNAGGGSGSAKGAAAAATIGALHGALSSPWGNEGDYWYSPHGLQDLGDPFYNAGRTKYGHKTHKASSTLRGISSALLGGSAGAGQAAGMGGGSGAGAASGYMALAAIVPQAIADILDNGWGVAWNEKLMNDVAENNQRANRLTSAVSKASSLDELSEFGNYLSPSYTITSDNVGEAGTFAGDKLDEKAAELNKAQDMSVGYLNRTFKNSALNLRKDQIGNYLRNYSAYGGPLGSPYGGALGLMQQNRYFDTIDKRSEAIAGKNNLNTAYTGGAKTFDFGGLKASFMDEFGTDPIAAAVRYSQGVERMQAEKEAAAAEAQREADYLATQQRLANLETQNQGLQALIAAQSMPTIETAEKTSESSSTPSPAVRKPSGNSTWDYVEDQLRKSGKFNDIQIEGIKYNLQRESSIDPTAVGDGGQAIGLGQWHGSRQPKDRSLEGQTQYLIDTLSNFDGKEHWIGRGNYEGFLNARTPEEAHYWIARGYERPAQRIIDKVKRDSDMSLSRLKAFGGELGTNGTDWTNGLLYIDEGGTHEENPMEGVPMGVDAEGIPNLVEEGETVYNNYVFSDRMNVPDFMYKELGLGGAIKKKGKGMSFADASKKLAQESEQRPNDPISQAGLEASLSKLAEVQETERMRQQAEEYMGLEGYACGGKMGRKYKGPGSKPNFLSGGDSWWPLGYDYEFTHDTPTMPMFDTPWGTGYFGTVDIRYPGDYVSTPSASKETSTPAASRISAPASSSTGNAGTKATIGNAGTASGTRATTDRSSNRNYGGVHADDIIAFDPEKAALEVAKTRKTVNAPVIDEATRQRIAMDGFIPEVLPEDARNINMLTTGTRKGEGYDPYPTWMRYAPTIGAGIMSLTDMLGLTNKPDYTMADKIEAAANGAAYAPNIEYKPIGDYMRYTPLDRMFHTNQLMASSRATDRELANSSSPSRAAGLLANGYNTTLSLGNLARQAEEYNRAQYERTKDFNRKTNMFNSQMDLEAAMANARYRQQAQSLGLSGLAQAAALRDSIDARTGAAKAANLSNFFTSLGNIGRENFALNQINSDRSRQYGVYRNGVSEHKRSSKGKKGSRWF